MRSLQLIREDIADLREWLKEGSAEMEHHISCLNGRSIEDFKTEYRRNIEYQILLLEHEQKLKE